MKTKRKKSSNSKMTKNSKRSIKVLNKNGSFVGFTSTDRAYRSVESDKSKWIDAYTIQVMYHNEDELRFRQEAFERDNYTCYLCGLEMHPNHPELTVDHVVPKRLGGSILLKNLACCCTACNKQKGHRTYEFYFKTLYAGLTYMILWWSRAEGGWTNHGNKNKKEKEKGRSSKRR